MVRFILSLVLCISCNTAFAQSQLYGTKLTLNNQDTGWFNTYTYHAPLNTGAPVDIVLPKDGTSGQALQTNGAGVWSFGTIVFPDDSGDYILNQKNVLQIASGRISGSFSTGGNDTAAGFVVRGAGGGGGAFSATGVLLDKAMSDGQLLIGGSGGAPTAATLTAGTGITITDAPGAIAIATNSSDSGDYILNQKSTLQTANYRISGSGSIGTYDTVFGSLDVGAGNTVSGLHAGAIGFNCTASGNYSFAAGQGSSGSSTGAVGLCISAATASYAFAAGNSLASGHYATALGGGSATADYSTAIGFSPTADGTYSFAMGQNASNGSNTECFVYGDNSAATSNDAANQFMVRTSGGYKLFDDATSVVAASLASGTGFVYNKTGLGSFANSSGVVVPGITAENTTASTSGTTSQLSPAIAILGTEWDGSASVVTGWYIMNAPIAAQTPSTLYFMNYPSGAPYAPGTTNMTLIGNTYGASLSFGLNSISGGATNSIVQGGDNGCCAPNSITGGGYEAVLGGSNNRSSGYGDAIIGSGSSYNLGGNSGIYSGFEDTIPSNAINGGNPGIGMVCLGGEGVTMFTNGCIGAGQFDTVPTHSTAGFSTSDAWLVAGNGTSYGTAKNNAHVFWKTGDITIGNLTNHKTITLTQIAPAASQIDTFPITSGTIPLLANNSVLYSGLVTVGNYPPGTATVTLQYSIAGAAPTVISTAKGVTTVTCPASRYTPTIMLVTGGPLTGGNAGFMTVVGLQATYWDSFATQPAGGYSYQFIIFGN